MLSEDIRYQKTVFCFRRKQGIKEGIHFHCALKLTLDMYLHDFYVPLEVGCDSLK